MKYAFYPGCVSRGACPELYSATIEVCSILGIELDEEALKGASVLGLEYYKKKINDLGTPLMPEPLLWQNNLETH